MKEFEDVVKIIERGEKKKNYPPLKEATNSMIKEHLGIRTNIRRTTLDLVELASELEKKLK